MPTRKKNKKRKRHDDFLGDIEMVKLTITLTKKEAEKLKKYQEAEDKFQADIHRIRKSRAGKSVIDRLL
jgi:hypothetical protein